MSRSSYYNKCPTSYDECVEIWKQARSCGKSKAVIGNNTELHFCCLDLEDHDEGEECFFTIKLHGHTIIYFVNNGVISLYTGGYKTRTTKERINRYLPKGFKLYQKDYEWYLETISGEILEFEEGMEIDTWNGLLVEMYQNDQ